MGARTKIEWTETTWNPVTGCTKVSPGCDHCYAERIVERFKGRGAFATIQLNEERLTAPLRWRRPRRVFVNSMSDLFHDAIPAEYIAKVFAVMAATPQHTYQVLTKRHGRMRSLLNDAGWRGSVFARESVLDLQGPARDLPVWPLANVWLGVSVESQQWADIRIPALLDTPAAVRWLSCEPLLGPLDLAPWMRPAPGCGHVNPDGLCGHPAAGTPECFRGSDCPVSSNTYQGLDWVVVGGESGHGSRPMHPDWARGLRDQCTGAAVPFFFKQWGEWSPLQHPYHYVTNDDRCQVVDASGQFRGRPWRGWRIQDGTRDAEVMRKYGKTIAGRELDGQTWDEYPAEVS